MVVVVVLNRPLAGNKLFARDLLLLNRSLGDVAGAAAAGAGALGWNAVGGRLNDRLGLGVVVVVEVDVVIRGPVRKLATGLGRNRPISGLLGVVAATNLISSSSSGTSSVVVSVPSSVVASVVEVNVDFVFRIFSVRDAEIPPKLEDRNRLIRELGVNNAGGLC